MAAETHPETKARAAAEAAARTAYGRLLALLAARTHDIAAAEDALADAFAAALKTWPDTGPPDAPEAWLLTAARRRLVDAARRARTVRDAEPDLTRLVEEAMPHDETSAFPDDRLKLLFICAHPAIDRAIRTPLMLQTVFGFSAERIAAAFLVSPAAMSQRLVRAKAKIRAARPGWGEPDRADWPGRLEAVLSAIYAAFNAGWEEAQGENRSPSGFAREAEMLARIVTHLLPDEGEAWGLSALIGHCEARRPARRDAGGRFIPLSEQDPGLWDAGRIDGAERDLRRALELGPPGRFTLEAAIQSAHAARRATGCTDWPAIAALYDRLLTVAPSTGGAVARAAAIGEHRGARAGLEALGEIARRADISAYQPYWAALGHLQAALGETVAAQSALQRAAGLTDDAAVRRFLLEKTARLNS